MLVVQEDGFNNSRLSTTLAVVLTSNTAQAAVPGNVFVPASASGLPQDSVANVTAIVTVDKRDLDPPVGSVSGHLLDAVDNGLRLVLSL